MQNLPKFNKLENHQFIAIKHSRQIILNHRSFKKLDQGMRFNVEEAKGTL